MLLVFLLCRHVIVLGDINTAHKMIDHCDPDKEELFNDHPGRKWLNQFLVTSEFNGTNLDSDTGSPLQAQGGLFVDTFRCFHPSQLDAYTNWCTVTSARQTNYGTRIDYIFADKELVDKEFLDCVIRADVEGSDHCPVVATLKTFFQAAVKPPSLCTKFMPEFSGKQQKLKSYFLKHGQQSQSQPEASSLGLSATQETKPSLKRSYSFGDDKSKSVKRQKAAGGKNKAEGQPKTNLLTFFKRSIDPVPVNKSVTKVTNEAFDLVKTTISEVEHCAGADIFSSDANTSVSSSDKPSDICENEPISVNQSSRKDCAEKRKVDSAIWKSILSGPRPPPLCSGHKEPCVLRTVKIKGPNQGRQFHCCARPQGHSSNPEARCNFFKWVK